MKRRVRQFWGWTLFGCVSLAFIAFCVTMGTIELATK